MKFKFNKKYLPLYIAGAVLLILLLIPSSSSEETSILNATVTKLDLNLANSNKPQVPVKSAEQKRYELCGDTSTAALIIKLKFSLGYDKEPSYDTGISYRLPGSKKDMKLTRLARSECNYEVGFSKLELKPIKDATIVVYGYQDALTRKISNEPINLKLIDGEPIDNRQVEVTLIK